MNRKQWYKQRRLFRIKRLVYYSYGDEVPTKVREEFNSFPEEIKSAGHGLCRSGYDIPELFKRTPRIKGLYPHDPASLLKWYETIRACMRANAAYARIDRCDSTPCGFRKPTPSRHVRLP